MIHLPELLIASRAEADEILSQGDDCGVNHLVSIDDPHMRFPMGYSRVPNKLRLEFHDVEMKVDGAVAPGRGDVEMLIDLAEHISDKGGKLLIHCGAGISRSTAAALIMFAVMLGPGREKEALSRVLDAAPDAMPNRLMVELADEILGREGNLLRFSKSL